MKLVKLTQVTQIGTQSEIRFQLSFPKSSNGAELFLEFLSIKKEYFKSNPAFEVRIDEKIHNDFTEIDYTVIKMNWVREVAQECLHFISKAIKFNPEGLKVIVEPN